jgi:hypothetical protein
MWSPSSESQQVWNQCLSISRSKTPRTRSSHVCDSGRSDTIGRCEASCLPSSRKRSGSSRTWVPRSTGIGGGVGMKPATARVGRRKPVAQCEPNSQAYADTTMPNEERLNMNLANWRATNNEDENWIYARALRQQHPQSARPITNANAILRRAMSRWLSRPMICPMRLRRMVTGLSAMT